MKGKEKTLVRNIGLVATEVAQTVGRVLFSVFIFVSVAHGSRTGIKVNICVSS